jgi:hypothetical protein
MKIADRWTYLATLLFALWVTVRMLGPNPIGKSDNGDFPKVLGPLGVWVAPQSQPDFYGYFVTGYLVDPNHTWNPGIPSTELSLAAAARAIGKRVLPPGRFDMRVLGMVHASLATLAFWLCLLPLQPRAWPFRTLVTILFFLVFSDPQYVQFFSTAYMDAASMVFLMLVFAAAWNAVLSEPHDWWAILFACFSCLFLGSKLHHQLIAIPLGYFALSMFFTSRRRVWLVAPFLMLATTIVMVNRSYPGYRVEPLFSAIFFKILPLAEHPEDALKELNRPVTEISYNRTHAFSPGSPLNSPTYRADFARDVTTGTLLKYYSRHPQIALTIMHSDFMAFAADLPLSSFGTMRRSDNPSPVFRVGGFQWWSAFRRASALAIPWHIAAIYLLVPLCCITVPRMLPLGIMISATGILSFAVGTLLDATETSRHILVFQQATDLLYLVFFYLIGEFISRRFQRPTS